MLTRIGIWRAESDARETIRGEAHKRAIKEVESLYTDWVIESFKLVIDEDVRGWKMVSLKRPCQPPARPDNS